MERGEILLKRLDRLGRQRVPGAGFGALSRAYQKHVESDIVSRDRKIGAFAFFSRDYSAPDRIGNRSEETPVEQAAQPAERFFVFIDGCDDRLDLAGEQGSIGAKVQCLNFRH